MISLISSGSIDKNIKIVRLNVMIGVQTPTPSLYVYKFKMTLSFCLSKKM